jgi:hypothetical protein
MCLLKCITKVNRILQNNQPTSIQREFFVVGYNDVWWNLAAFLEGYTDSILRMIEARDQYEGGNSSLAAYFVLITCLAYPSILKVEPVCSSEMSVDPHQTTWCYIPEDRSLHNHHLKSLKSCNHYLFMCVHCVYFSVREMTLA